MKKLLLFIFALIMPATTFAGFGVSPAEINQDGLVPGITYREKIYLVQGNPNQDVTVHAEVTSGSSIADWITFDHGEDFVIPAGTQQFPVEVIVTVPEDAPLNVYDAAIRFSSVPNQELSGGQVAIALAAKVDLSVVVGDDVISSYEVKLIEINDVHEGENTEARLKIHNTGNVEVSPERISFELFNKFGDIRLSYSEAESISSVPAFTEEFITVNFPLAVSVGPGEYWGQVRVYDIDGVIAEEKTVFNVFEKTFWQKYQLYLMSAGALIGLIVIIILLFTFVFRRKK